MVPFLNDAGIEVLSEIIYNSLYSSWELSHQKRKKLAAKINPKLTKLKKISKETTPVGYKRKVLKQEGGGILTTIATVLVPAIVGLLAKKK